MKKPIEVGDVVRLRSGSPNMLVSYYVEPCTSWFCIYADGGRVCTGAYRADELTVVLPNPEPKAGGVWRPTLEERQLREAMQKEWLEKVPDAARIPVDILDAWEGQILVEARMVPGRGLCVLRRFIYTTGLLVGARFDVANCYYDARYCYPCLSDAKAALRTWDGVGDPGGDWVKEKVSERLGPAADVTDEQRAAHEARRLAGTLP